VGHETDFTIADFVADLRAPTPTAAAELATPNQADLRLDLAELNDRVNRLFQAAANELRWAFRELQNRLERNSPINQIQTESQHVDELERRLNAVTGHLLQLARTQMAGLIQHMSALSPTSVMERGYAIVTNRAGETILQVAQVSAGQALKVQVSDGDFGVHVDGKHS
jgi:exodeoxyribonuclease VII large subunit